MKHSKLAQVLGTLVQNREPALLVGAPGIGKTDCVQSVARALDAELVVSHPVVSDPTDYKGMPAVFKDGDDTVAQFLPFGDLQALIRAPKPTMFFMDDIGQAPPAVQAALMQLVLARRVNGHAVSPNVVFVAATNRRQDRAGVTGMLTPLLDRFVTVLTLDFDLEDWVRWALQNQMPPELAAFARFRPELVGKFEPTRDMAKSPTPRSVAGVGRLLNLGLNDPETLAGAAGEAFATELLAFIRTWAELPDRTEIYMNPTKVAVPSKPDVLYALMGSLAFGADPKNFDATATYLARCPAEFSVLCVKDALARQPKLKTSRAFTTWATTHASVFGFDA